MNRPQRLRLQSLVIVIMILPVAPQFAVTSQVKETDQQQSESTQDAVKIAYSYDNGGGYIWKGSTGVNETLTHQGETVLEKQPVGTYCCGFTLQVAFKFAQQRGLFDGNSFEEIRRFQREWYGSTEASGETQCTLAMTNLGVGHAVSHDDARPGDFGNFWRTKSGHSVVFLNWITDDDGNRIGIHYRSSQGKTDGIGDRTEYFKNHGGHVDPDRLYLCRFNEPNPRADEDDVDADPKPRRGANR
jgi:hypothetical protein